MKVMKTILAAVLALGGCSVIVVRPSPREPSQTCRSYVPAVVDGVIAVALLGLTLRTIHDRDCGPDGCHTFDPSGLYVVSTVLFGSSTIWGVAAEGSCRRALAVPR
ncbi:MAG: hypothetical protein WKG01_25580 [Kofleriaceae bacterium]